MSQPTNVTSLTRRLTQHLCRYRMTFRRWLLIVLLLCVVPQRARAQNSPHGKFQFVHALVDIGPVDLYVNGDPFATGVAYQSATQFQTLIIGQHRVTMFLAGTDTTGLAPLAQGVMTVSSNDRGILAAIGHADEPRLILRKGVREHANSQFVELFLIHGAPDAGPVDLRLRDPFDNNRIVRLLFNNFGYARTSTYTRIALQGYNYEVVQSSSDVIIGTFFLNLSGFSNRSGVVITSGRGTSSGEGFSIVGIDTDGTVYEPYVTTRTTTEVPKRDAVASAYPNPFSEAVQVPYAVGQPAHITLRIVNMQGRTVITLHDGWHAAGIFDTTWDGRTATGAPAPSGLYLLQHVGPNGALTKRMVLAR